METDSLADLLRREVQRVDPNLPVHSIQTLEHIVAERSFGFRIVSVLFMLLGSIALFLSCLGIYAVMAFAVGRRQREIGIRVALGAQRGQVLGLVVRGAMTQILIGLGVGFLGAVFATRVLSLFMYEVGPNDPLVFGITLLLLLLTALAACMVPARRASGVDPLTALRAD
jgi:putative ABC transport system permease protein